MTSGNSDAIGGVRARGGDFPRPCADVMVMVMRMRMVMVMVMAIVMSRYASACHEARVGMHSRPRGRVGRIRVCVVSDAMVVTSRLSSATDQQAEQRRR